MIITKKALARRTFLRGMGATLALPLLDAMVPALSAMGPASSPVRRLGFIYIPMGANMAQWTPPGADKLGELSPILNPLMPFRDHLTVLTNLELRLAYTEAAGNHALANSTFLSCVAAKRTEGSDYYLGTTVDQMVAKHIGNDTPLRSLELGTNILAQVGDCDAGYACAYMNNLSWSSPTNPLPTEADPRVVFERMFGEGGSAADRRADLRKKHSILDVMTEDIARLQRKVGPSDGNKISEYLDSVRELERRIQNAEQKGAESVMPDLERPLSAPASWEDHVKLMYDLQLLALQADITRVISFQLARESNPRTYPQIGVPEPHHPLSHHHEEPEKLARLAKINRYHMSLFAYFLEKMKATPDGDGSLLDHTIYMYGSGMGNSSAHDHENLPAILVGGGAGQLKGGRHVRYPKPTPMANLHLTLLEKMGISLESFGDSTGKIGDI